MSSKYYKNLDIFRVVLCIAVLLYHMNLLKGGFLAVCCFFVLSGYLSFKSLSNKKKISLKEYYVNKLLKIYLPLLVVVFLTILGVSFFKDISWISLKPETTSVIFGYNNFWQIGANLDYFARHVSSPFMHFWYIAILLQFDLIFPFIFLLFGWIKEKLGKVTSCVLSVIISLIFTGLFVYSVYKMPVMVVYYNTLFRIFSLFIGVTLGMASTYYESKISGSLSKHKNFYFYSYLILLVVLFVFVAADSKYFGFMMVLSSLISCRIIDYSVNMSSTFDKKKDGLLKYFAGLCYEIYLVQYPVIFFLERYNLNKYLNCLLIVLLIVIISVIVNYSCSFNKNVKKKNILKYVLSIIVFSLSLYGVYQFAITEDHTEEMKLLEEQLAENEKLMQEKQKDYENKLKQEQEEWEKMMDSFDEDESNLANAVLNMPVVGVGDSVMLGAVNTLYAKFPNGYFDAKVSRTAWVVNGILLNLKNSNMLGNPIILNLGANGDCPDSCKQEIMSTIGDRDVFWVNVTNDRDVHVNDKLLSFSSQYNNLHVVDWNSYSSGHYEYFVADGIHLTEPGKVAYVDAIYNTMYNYYLEKVKQKKEEMLMAHEAGLKEKYTFYGNDLLLNAYDSISDKFSDAKYNINNEFDYKTLKKQIADDIKNNNLNYNVVMVFDESFVISNEQYNELFDLLKDNKVYVVSVDGKKIKSENVNIIDFSKEIKNNSNYIMVDGKHLSNAGNTALGEVIYKNVFSKED